MNGAPVDLRTASAGAARTLDLCRVDVAHPFVLVHLAAFAGACAASAVGRRGRKWTRSPSRIQNVAQGNDWATGQNHDQLLALLNAGTKPADWQPRVMASNLSDANIVSGRGFAWSNADNATNDAAVATIADIEVNKKTGKITVKHVYAAASAGLVVYPGGIENQMVGGMVQTISRLLTEHYRYSRRQRVSVLR